MEFKQIKDIFPKISVALFNLAVWQKPGENSLFFIGREVSTPGEIGQPDNGVLKLFEMNKHGHIIHEKTIWSPIYGGINLEDPRALELPNENLIIGFTAVLRGIKKRPFLKNL